MRVSLKYIDLQEDYQFEATIVAQEFLNLFLASNLFVISRMTVRTLERNLILARRHDPAKKV